MTKWTWTLGQSWKEGSCNVAPFVAQCTAVGQALLRRCLPVSKRSLGGSREVLWCKNRQASAGCLQSQH